MYICLYSLCKFCIYGVMQDLYHHQHGAFVDSWTGPRYCINFQFRAWNPAASLVIRAFVCFLLQACTCSNVQLTSPGSLVVGPQKEPQQTPQHVWKQTLHVTPECTCKQKCWSVACLSEPLLESDHWLKGPTVVALHKRRWPATPPENHSQSEAIAWLSPEDHDHGAECRGLGKPPVVWGTSLCKGPIHRPSTSLKGSELWAPVLKVAYNGVIKGLWGFRT